MKKTKQGRPLLYGSRLVTMTTSITKEQDAHIKKLARDRTIGEVVRDLLHKGMKNA